jgi:hypothetical protein
MIKDGKIFLFFSYCHKKNSYVRATANTHTHTHMQVLSVDSNFHENIKYTANEFQVLQKYWMKGMVSYKKRSF